MLDISKHLKRLKTVVKQQEDKDKELKKGVAQALSEIFGVEIPFEKYIQELYVKQNTLVVITTTKVFSNELYRRRQELLERLGTTHQIRDIRIH